MLQDVEGRQLLCEAVYLYGCMLLLMDLRIPGPARERIVISFLRYKVSLSALISRLSFHPSLTQLLPFFAGLGSGQ